MRELLGGKGADLAEMTRVLGPERVPAGSRSEACVAYMKAGKPEGMAEQVADALERLQARAGKRLGNRDDPLLVSVRSGARESMPGMLDTVLNLGLNDESVEGLARATGNPRFAWDSYRRFVQMFGNVSRGVPGERFEAEIEAIEASRAVKLDTELGVDALQELTARFKALYAFPQDPHEQLRLAIHAVFDSWTGKRAIEYRRINRIRDDWGTAVSVQQMVFGNKGETSGSGVAFSRDEVTGAPSRAETSSPTPRVRTSSPACARPVISPRCATGCRRRMRSCWRSCGRSAGRGPRNTRHVPGVLGEPPRGEASLLADMVEPRRRR
jgi:pyruvate,orthophosphate dikinase